MEVIVKLFMISSALGNGILFGGATYLLQIIPGDKASSESTVQAYLISVIVALAGTISFLFIYSKSLNKIIKKISEDNTKQLQEVYREQIKDYKDVTSKNTAAFLENSSASKEVAASNKENTKALSDLRLWLIENLEISRKK